MVGREILNQHGNANRTQDYGKTLDFAATPPKVTRLLLRKETLDGGTILDPCCGIGGVSEPLREHGLKVVSRDLVDRGYKSLDKTEDFLNTRMRPAHVVCNPPFALTQEFLHKALKITKGKVILLNHAGFLSSIGRYWLFKETPLSKVYVLSRKLPIYRGGKWTGGGAFTHIWLVWDKTIKINKPVTLDWLLEEG